MSDTVQLAEALKVLLAGGSFSLPITVQRTYVPTFTLMDLENVQVTVTPATVERSNVSRSHRQFDRGVEVAVNKRVSAISIPNIDALVDLTEEIADFLDGQNLGTPEPVYQWQGTEVIPYDQEVLHSKNVFVSLLTVTYRLVKSI
jgi:hypothetical protein